MMMINNSFLVQIVSSIVLFFALNYGIYKFTGMTYFPNWLDYQPFSCRKCCFFWCSMFTYVAIGFVTHFKYLPFFVIGILLVVLNTIALYVDEKNKIDNERK